MLFFSLSSILALLGCYEQAKAICGWARATLEIDELESLEARVSEDLAANGRQDTGSYV